MTTVFLGDAPFYQMLADGASESKLDVHIKVYQVTNIQALRQFALPNAIHDAEFLVVGCLGSLVSSLIVSRAEKRDATLGNRNGFSTLF
jgi:hypothetical protein